MVRLLLSATYPTYQRQESLAFYTLSFKPWWDIWLFQLDDVRVVIDVVEGHRQCGKVRGEGFSFEADKGLEWQLVRKGEGDDWAVVQLPPPSTDYLQLPIGHDYIVRLSLSWKGVPLYRGTFRLLLADKSITPCNYGMSER